MHGEYKVPGGKLVVADLEVRDGRLADVRISGDFFLEPPEALDAINRGLNGLPADTKYLELGRSCVLKSYRARPGTMQLLWKGLMAYVARFDIDLMFGCASLAGNDPDALALPLSYLHHFHAMPAELNVRARPELFVDMNRMAKDAIEPREGLRSLPPLLKGYVRAGCRIGDGAVIDRQFGTTDVFIYFPLSGIDARYKSRFGLAK